MANDVQIVITAVDRTGPAFDSAIRRAQQLAQAMRQTGQITNQALNSITQNANQAAHALHNMGQQGQGSANQVGQGAGGAAGLMDKLGGAGAAAGAAIGVAMAAATAAVAGLKKVLEASIERANVGAKIGAQTGLVDPERIGQLGRLAGKVYADNFGDSLQTAGNAVRDVIRNKLVPPDAGDAAVKAISEKLLTIGDIAEADSSEVARAVRQMLNTGLVKSADEALDVITKGFQTGTDAAGDLLDTFTEYGTQFRKLGLDGATALGLLNQGLKGGARDADIVADALKEFSIRAIDGSKATIEGFKALGFNADAMASKIASGGKGASEGLDQVLDGLRKIEDPVKRAAVATALFGTQSEDLGKALETLDVTTAATELGKIEGAADAAAKALGQGLGPTLETFKRKAQQALADIGDKIAPFISKFIENYEKFAKQLGDVFDGSEVPGQVMESIRKVAEEYGPALGRALGHIADKVKENKAAFEILGRVLAEYIIPFLGGTLLVGLQLAAGAIGRVIESVGLLVVGFEVARTKVVELVTQLAQGVLRQLDTIITGAAKAFGWAGDIGKKLDAAAKEFHEFVGKVNNELSNLRDHDVYIRTHFVGGQGQARGGEYRTGGIIGGMSAAATGGVRQGLVKVGEEGSEFVRLPTGSMVYPKANTRQMEAMGTGGGGQGPQKLRVEFGGNLDSAMAQWFMEAQRSGAVTIYATAIT